HAGRTGCVEIVDGLDAESYAWIAAGRFDPPLVAVPTLDPGLVARREGVAAHLAEALRLRELGPALARIPGAEFADPSSRAAAARALVAFRPDVLLAALVAIVADPTTPAAVRNEICQAATTPDGHPSRELLTRTMRVVPYPLQVALVTRLA